MPELDSNPNPLLSRVELLRLAQGLGVVDADVMTRAELRAAIDKAQRPERAALDPHPVTWVGVARRLLASVVERGLNLPDAAALIRGDTKLMAPPMASPPVATVTLARIYAAQGHLDRAIVTLDEVLESDPDHELARDLRTQLDLRRTEIAQREGAPAAARAREEERARAAGPSNGHARAVAAEAAPANEPAALPEAPPVASVDAAAELVAPSFDTVERQAAHADLSPFPTEPPTLVGVVPLDVDAPAAANAPESEPPTPLAAGVDWQIENDSAASADALPEAETPRWAAASADTVDAAPVTDAVLSPPVGAALDATSPPEPPASAPEAFADAPEALVAADIVEAGATVAAAAVAAETVSAASADSAIADAVQPAASVGIEPPPSAPHAMNGVANGVAPAPGSSTAGAAAAAAEPLPRVPGLLLIETDTMVRYIYWELAAAGSPHWIHVVTHTPTGRGDTERRERRFPVYRQLGVLRLEGVPRQAVVRAKLTHAADDVRPLVVAGAVRPRALADGSFEVRYAPHGKATPEALAGRARPLLERANPVYWDS
jgi:hypothetical protein